MKHNAYLFRSLVIGLFCFFSFAQSSAQNTVGLLSYEPSASFDGFNLIYPHNQSSVFLLDNCGEIVHTWPDADDQRPGNTAYILPNGNLIRCKRPASIAGDAIWAGGGGATVEMLDWDNNLIWAYTLNNEFERLHHDIALVPNGNVLMVAWQKVELEALLQAGRDTSILGETELWYDKVIEFDGSTGDIVWEWHAWDHLVQDFDDTKANFGVVADSPNKIDLNFVFPNAIPADWTHINAIDYHPINNQILLCVPHFNEVWIIDRGNDTDLSAGPSGDLRYRWGNPIAYQSGDASDQKLFFPHDAQWNDDFLTGIHPNFDQILVFNNQIGPDFSAVTFFDHGYEMYTDTFPFNGTTFGPEDVVENITHPTPTDFFSSGLSSAQCLPNGNILMCAGRFGYSVELTPDQEIVWEYVTPFIGGGGSAVQATQGDLLEINNNLTFRNERYPADFEAFEGRDLSSKGFIELEPDEEFCSSLISSIDDIVWYDLAVYPNPAQDRLTIQWEGFINNTIEIFDLTGRLTKSFEASGGTKFFDVSDWQEGLYFVRINERDVRKVQVIH